MRRLTIALLVSVLLHASLVLVRCGTPSPSEEEWKETLVELQSEVPPEPVEAPAQAAAAPPPPPPPVAEIPPDPAPSEPDAPAETVRPPEPETTQPIPQPTSPVESTAPSTATPSASPSASTHTGSGNSETATVGAATLDNKDFKPFGNQKPAYPDAARRMGLEGSATLRILVNPAGKVEQIEVQSWNGHASFGSAAAQTAKGWRFAPPRRNGRPVSAWYTRTIAFKLREN